MVAKGGYTSATQTWEVLFMLLFDRLYLVDIIDRNPSTRINLHKDGDQYVLTVVVRVSSDEDIDIPSFLSWDKTDNIIYCQNRRLCSLRFDYYMDGSM